MNQLAQTQTQAQAQQPRSMNILFYSKFSNMCTDLLKMMDSYNILNKFLLRCIDDMQELPPGLERVPTLIVVGIEKPLVAREAVNWFNTMRPVFMQQHLESQNKNIMHNITKNELLGISGPQGFSDMEHSGMSDSYAYTNSDASLEKAYCSYGSDTQVIFTPPKENDKINQLQQINSSRDLETQRKKQEQEFSNIMKKNQVDALINQEKNKLLREKLGIN